jgi:hypothetical protein
MKKLSSTDLFNIFSQQDHEVFADNGMVEQIDNDFITFGTIIIGMRNYQILDNIYRYRYEEQYDSVKDQLQLKYFDSLMRYASRIDQLSLDTVNDLNDEFGKQEIIGMLEYLIQFYQQQEHYEKCAVIFKLLQKFQ